MYIYICIYIYINMYIYMYIFYGRGSKLFRPEMAIFPDFKNLFRQLQNTT